MNKKRSLLLLLTMALLSPLFSQEKSVEEISNKELLSKIESMEVELEKLKIEKEDNGILARGAMVNWGQGANMAMQWNAPSNFAFTIGYTGVKTSRFQKKQDQYPLSKSKKVRYSLGLRGKVHLAEALKVTDEKFVPTGYSLGINARMGSPVMLNLISISTYLTPFVLWADVDSTSGYSEIEGGMDFGSDIEFWVTPKSNVTVGYIYSPVIYGKIRGDAPAFAPASIKLCFGVNWYFKKG